MNVRIICYTLFNITQTGINVRAKPDINDLDEWTRKRNTQWNLDTIIQLVSLRAQPELLTFPEKISANKKKFGTIFETEKNLSCWKFTFSVNYESIYDNGDDELGYLYEDCHNIPMLLIGDENKKLKAVLDTSKELRNIYFEYEQNKQN